VFNFSDLIDDYLKREEKRFPPDEIHPHEIGSCLRHTYYKRLIPKPVPKDRLRLFKAGDFAHYFIRAVLRSSSRVELVGWERPFELDYGDFKIAGRLDDLITVRLAGERLPIVIEVKSVGGRSVDFIREPKLHHVYQIHPYLRAADARLGVIWYVARQTFADKWFSVFYDQRVMDEVIVRARLLHQYLSEGRLPPPEGRNSRSMRWLCWFCPWWKECQADFNPRPAGGGADGG
jgi:hypothetical protein